MVSNLHGQMTQEIEAIKSQALVVAAAQQAETMASSSQEVEDTKRQALVELQIMKDQLGTIMATYFCRS